MWVTKLLISPVKKGFFTLAFAFCISQDTYLLYNTGSAKTIMIFVSLSFIVQPVSNETVAKYSSISYELVARALAQVCIGTFSLLAQTQAHPP